MDNKKLEQRLSRRLDKQGAALRDRQKQAYNFAKSLGFSAREAGVMQNWKHDDIRALAVSRGYIKEI
jgi:hypothetical protein